MFKRLVVVVACVLVAGSVWAGPKSNDELTFSAALSKPDSGDTVWSLTGECLFPLYKNLLIGPSVTMLDLGDTDGGQVGVTTELGIGRTSGVFVGARVTRPTGDFSDVADYVGEARVGVKFGGEKGFVKLYASQTWSRLASGSTTDPDSTDFVAGLGIRF